MVILLNFAYKTQSFIICREQKVYFINMQKAQYQAGHVTFTQESS